MSPIVQQVIHKLKLKINECEKTLMKTDFNAYLAFMNTDFRRKLIKHRLNVKWYGTCKLQLKVTYTLTHRLQICRKQTLTS